MKNLFKFTKEDIEFNIKYVVPMMILGMLLLSVWNHELIFAVFYVVMFVVFRIVRDKCMVKAGLSK
jgi:type IV secretory pathway VirB3-like protein